jgi:hypothetical protein
MATLGWSGPKNDILVQAIAAVVLERGADIDVGFARAGLHLDGKVGKADRLLPGSGKHRLAGRELQVGLDARLPGEQVGDGLDGVELEFHRLFPRPGRSVVFLPHVGCSPDCTFELSLWRNDATFACFAQSVAHIG